LIPPRTPQKFDHRFVGGAFTVEDTANKFLQFSQLQITFFFTAIQCTFTLFPSPNSTNVIKLHATHNSITPITTFALISRPVSVHVTVNKHSGLIKYIHRTLTNTIPATLVDSSCHSAH
jgi:hypothetical protein